MLSIDPQRYIQAFERAPAVLRDLSGSWETTEVIRALGERYRLEERVAHVARMTAYVLVGLLPLAKFRETIQEEAGLDEEAAREIAREIRDKVFARAVEELRAMHNIS